VSKIVPGTFNYICEQKENPSPEAKAFMEREGESVFFGLAKLVGPSKTAELLSLPRKAIIRHLVETNEHTYREIADAFGVSRQAIQEAAPGKGFVQKDPEPKWLSPIARKLVAKGVPVEKHREWLVQNLIVEGNTQEALASVLGISQMGLSGYARSLGIDLAFRRGKVIIPIPRKKKYDG